MPYDKVIKDCDIEYIREQIGWAYQDMKWLSKEEAVKAGRERNELLRSVSGRVIKHFNESKISTGPLSPGCMTCGKGTWSCIFIGSLCTANCFYCPQDRKQKKDEPPNESGLIFYDPGDYVEYLEKFKFKGVSFSGGEPFLKFKEVLVFIKKIRERLGRGIYIWIYTNGDLVDEKKLKALNQAGLNEIRFDIAARKYSLKAVKMAIGIIDRVTVEIPAIPEDYEILKKCLPKMKAIGVAHLNLHQLNATQQCFRSFVDRGYTFLHQPNIAILESEMTALRIVKYVLDNNIGLSVNYCTPVYKHRFQKKAYRKRFQPYLRQKYEDLTESEFIRRLSIQDKSANLKELVRMFQKNKTNDDLWFFNESENKLFFHHSLLDKIDFGRYNLIVNYYTPMLTTVSGKEKEIVKEVVLNAGRKFMIERNLLHELTIDNPVAAKFFQELYVEKKNEGDALKRFYSGYKLKTKADVNEMMNEKDSLCYLKTWEFIGSGLYEIY
ncbi:MAG: 4Fe-4S cluster-binding domain-containing protein [Smithella sp.]|nr:4Fe-4S cluster-binding domain-containing protein [Smithella sp.]